MATIPNAYIFGGYSIRTQTIKQFDERGFFLSVYFLEFDDVWLQAFHDIGREEVRGGVFRLESIGLIRGDDWRELIEVANKNHLDSAKWFTRPFTIQAQCFINAVEKIGSHHGYLVDDDGIERFKEGKGMGERLSNKRRGDRGMKTKK